MANKGQGSSHPFKKLETVQVLELSVIVRGPFSGNLDTTLEIGYGVNSVARTDRDTDVVAIPMNFKAVAGTTNDDQEAVLEGRCRLVGIWQVPSGFVGDTEELRLLAAEHAIPKLYLLARQHLGDVMGKVGARVDAWTWEPPGTTYRVLSTAKSTSVKSKNPRNRRSALRKSRRRSRA